MNTARRAAAVAEEGITDMPEVKDAVAFVTGANGGLGREFVAQALERGAAKVYASARTPRNDWGDPRVSPIRLDVTSAESIAAAVADAGDTTLLINNAGISNRSSVLGDLTGARELFETNVWGALAVVDAFVPVLVANRGAVLNLLSALSWLGTGDAYSAAKAALWSATNTQRLRLFPRGVHIAALHSGFIDTPMTAGIPGPKNSAADVVRAAYDGLEAGEFEILADDLSRQVKAGLAGPIETLYPELMEHAR
jgi:NAD(P)-dependent dehydrogenase (short-subunit alcohol dehydrogenase family)